jgi:hypothetical protein
VSQGHLKSAGLFAMHKGRSCMWSWVVWQPLHSKSHLLKRGGDVAMYRCTRALHTPTVRSSRQTSPTKSTRSPRMLSRPPPPEQPPTPIEGGLLHWLVGAGFLLSREPSLQLAKLFLGWRVLRGWHCCDQADVLWMAAIELC